MAILHLAPGLGNRHPSLAQAYQWSLQEITRFIDEVANEATAYNKAGRNAGDDLDLARAAQDVYRILTHLDGTRTQPDSSVLYSNDLDDKRLVFEFLDSKIRSTTLYDTLGYILSVVSALPPNMTNNPVGDYYFPLLSVYAKWCNEIATITGDDAGTFMYHITFFPWSSDGSTRVLIGSTIGSNDGQEIGFRGNLRKSIQQSRQKELEQLGYRPPELNEKGSTNFGSCAESDLFIWLKQSKIPSSFFPQVNGFALNVRFPDESVPENYGVRELAGKLRNPCRQSCQVLLRQLNWPGRGFNVDAVKKDLGIS